MAGQNRGPELAAVGSILLFFGILTVGLRCYTALYILKKRFYAEDWLAVFTLVIFIAYSSFGLLAVRYGLGGHVDEVSIDSQETALMFLFLGQVSYVVVAVLVKFVAGVLLLRICLHQRWQRITIWTMLVTLALFSFAYFFVILLQCHPIRFYWSRDRFSPIKSAEAGWGDCHSRRLATIPTYISFLLNVLVDWTLALLPISFVWNAKMDFKTKFSVVGLLAVGVLASIATVMRVPYAKHLNSSPDFLYNFAYLAQWSTVEIGLGIIASSCATLRPLFRKIKLLPSMIYAKSIDSSSSSQSVMSDGRYSPSLGPRVVHHDPWAALELGLTKDDRPLVTAKHVENRSQGAIEKEDKDAEVERDITEEKRNVTLR